MISIWLLNLSTLQMIANDTGADIVIYLAHRNDAKLKWPVIDAPLLIN